MKTRNACRLGVFLLLAAFPWPTHVLGHNTKDNQRLSKIGPAPEFTLTAPEGAS